jgi:hypothetical protein
MTYLAPANARISRAALLALIASFLAAPLLSQAQSAYRCDEDGKAIYQATPCSGGRAITGDARSDAERSAAAAGVKNDAKLAAQLAKERKERDKATAPGGISSIKPAPAVLPAKVETVEYVKVRKVKKPRRVKTDPNLLVVRAPVERKQRASLKTK